MPSIHRIDPLIPSLPSRKRVAAYARVSSDKGASLHSLSAQVSHYSAYIQKNRGWEYAGVYADVDTPYGLNPRTLECRII